MVVREIMVYGKSRSRFSIDEILGNTDSNLKQQQQQQDAVKESKLGDVIGKFYLTFHFISLSICLINF